MLYDLVNPETATSPEDLRQQYESKLANIVHEHGIGKTRQTTGLDRETLEKIEQGAPPALDVNDVASLVALATDSPSVEPILAESRDRLLLQMSTAILNVDVLAQELPLDLDPNEIQGKIEGRLPMTLEEYAILQYYLVKGINS